MPRVTQYADIVAGNGAAVSLNGTVLAGRGTVACFLDPSRVMYQRLIDPVKDVWQLEVYDLATKQSAKAPCGERGANFLAARGGRWMAYAAGLGLYDASGSIWPYAGLAATGTDGRGAIGQDGTIGFVRDRANGRGLQLLTVDGEATDLPDIAIQTLCIFDRTLAIWVDGGQVRAWGWKDPAPQAEPVSSARVIKVGGLLVLLVTTNTGLILRRWDDPVGKVVIPTPTAFAADFALINPTTIRIVSSRTVGEPPEDIEIHDESIATVIERVPGPINTKERPMKTKDEVRAIIERIFNFYMNPEGLNRRARGLPPPVDHPGADPAFWDWVALGLAVSPEEVERQIRNHPGGEWQREHPHENPR